MKMSSLEAWVQRPSSLIKVEGSAGNFNEREYRNCRRSKYW